MHLVFTMHKEQINKQDKILIFLMVTLPFYLLVILMLSLALLMGFCFSEECRGGYKKDFFLIFVPRKSLLCEKKLKVCLFC